MHTKLSPIVTALLGIGVFACAHTVSAETAAIAPQPGVLVGQVEVSGPTWNFSGNLPKLRGRWGSVTVTNTNCTTLFRPGTALAVCLTLDTPPPMLAEINVDQQYVAAGNSDVTGVATAAADQGETFIAIAGAHSTPDGANPQWVFFFLGDQYLGTDTFRPSLSPLQPVGSPGPNQIDIRYTDPAGGAPLTITYTLSNGAMTASGTPPGR